jgi:hypothetical protein
VKPEVQLQFNLTACASWLILPIAKHNQRIKKMSQEGRKWRKKRQEEQSGNWSTDSVRCQLWVWTRWPNLYTLVRVTYSGLTQSVFRLDRVKSSSCDCPAKISVDIYPNTMAALRLLVLVAAHSKLRSFVRLCAWSMLLLRPKPSLAHYPAFTVCLVTTLFKK